jgi:phosphotransferase system HPr (HPr) family protein
MLSKKVIVRNEHGLHARVALRVIETSRDFHSQVTITSGSTRARANSIVDLMLLGAKEGSEIEVSAQGGDEEKSIQAISEIFSEGAGI